ncbi:hypothetical protein BCL76_1268 [Streptomyces sp. CG 926]|uniref:hypothetical protein n=1 Tax=Streptomyces sp. CG 926 TaxID=1882405 RepID=UPI000D6D7534|nr:hypothetical protein [Streptomyces sp. CG 926]PWK61802.1 hypothetical protein BCL76_1268 [Streptomyces sp. CG 926]
MIRQLLLTAAAAGTLALGVQSAWASDTTPTSLVAQVIPAAAAEDDSGWQGPTPAPTAHLGTTGTDDSGWQTPPPPPAGADDSGWQNPTPNPSVTTNGDDSGWQ